VAARRRGRVLDRQGQQLLARRADLDVGVHLGALARREPTASLRDCTFHENASSIYPRHGRLRNLAVGVQQDGDTNIAAVPGCE